MKVSVIVPVYNSALYLPQCLDSLVSQTIDPIEIICINDGSTDESGLILDTYKHKYQNIRVIHQGNRGVGIARNVGVNLAIGDYIGFVDSDDMVAPSMYSLLYDKALGSGADIVICKAYSINRYGKDIRPISTWGNTLKGNYGKKDIVNIDFLNTGCSPVLWDKLFKNHIVKKTASMNLPRGQDFVALIDYIHSAETFNFFDSCQYYYRHHPLSNMSKSISLKVLLQDLETEFYASSKIVKYYSGYPICSFYLHEVVDSWMVRLSEIQCADNKFDYKSGLSKYYYDRFIFLKEYDALIWDELGSCFK